MAFAKEDVAAAIAKFRENPFWNKKFMDAPTGAQKRLALSFFFSECKGDDGFDLMGYRNFRDYIEKSLTAEDLDYLIENDSNENAKRHFAELKAMLPPSQQQAGSSRPDDYGSGAVAAGMTGGGEASASEIPSPAPSPLSTSHASTALMTQEGVQ